MGRDINPVIFKNLKAFLGVFFKEVNFWPLILDISWVSGGMIALFWRKMLFFGSFVLFSVGKHFWCISEKFGKFRMHFGHILEISVTWYECCNVIRSEFCALPQSLTPHVGPSSDFSDYHFENGKIVISRSIYLSHDDLMVSKLKRFFFGLNNNSHKIIQWS